MKSRFFGSLGILALLPALCVGQATKSWTAPLTRDGQPDLQGVWLSHAVTPLERPKELEGRASVTDAEVAELKKRGERLFHGGENDYTTADNALAVALSNPTTYSNPNKSTGGAFDNMIELEFDHRTSLIVDPPNGRIPPMTPAGKRRQAEALLRAVAQPPPAGPEELSNFQRCITFGVPRLGGNFGAGPYSYYQIMQTPGYVIVFMELIHDARVIPLDGRPHLPSSVRTWNGDSRGRWEGQTLVVDTTNFSAESSFLGAAENLHLVERFTRVAADEVDYEITADDPTTWTKPWTAMVRLRSSPEKIYEYACHEGNSISVTSILAAARAQEKAADKAAETGKPAK